MRTRLYALMGASLLALSACGQSQLDRGLSGAGIGAATGAVSGALLGDTLGGAVLGGVAGGAVGVLTDDRDFSLGQPIWK